MRLKALVNSLPIAIALIAGYTFYHQWQQASAKPSYEGTQTVQHNLTQAPGQSERWQVVRVSDGDTLVARKGEGLGKETRIRLCGIDSPESQQPLGREAKAYLQSMVQAAGNQIIVMPIERDRYGRLVAEVFVSAPTQQHPELEKFVNHEMVAGGLAYHYLQFSDSCPNRESFVEGETEAKQQRRGVWAYSNSIKPWDYRKAQRAH